MIRPLAALLAVAAVTASLASTAPAQQLVQRRDLSYALALSIATGAIDACKALGLNATAVAVVDRAGETIVMARDDNARPHAMEAARRKAYTARTFAIPTTQFGKEMERPSRRAQMLLPNVTSLDGGVPIKLGNEVIGGVGVAGSPGKDEECASAGLDKVKQALQ